MPKPEKMRDTGCPVSFALDTFGDRWSLLVVRDIVLKGHKTFGQFLASNKGFATNVLADRLKQLEAAGILRKSRDPENRRKVNYALTEKGRDLLPVILEMIRWSAKYDPNTLARKHIVEGTQRDRDKLVADLLAKLDAE